MITSKPLINRSIVVSTDETVVRFQLRLLNQPMTLFGELPADRRERLRSFLAENPEAIEVLKTEDAKKKNTQQEDEEFFYYEGSELLKKIRYKIASSSFLKCYKRLELERSFKETKQAQKRFLAQRDAIEKVSTFQDDGIYHDDDSLASEGLKSINSISLNASSSLLATAHSNGICKLWEFPQMVVKSTMRGHNGIMARCITFHPYSGLSQSTSCVNLASCAMDGSVILWNLDSEEPFVQLSKPSPWKVTRTRFYIDGSLLATCCTDNSWRLFDLHSNTELLHQEGHADSVHDVSFHPDGSIACTASFDKTSYFWDLRTGRSIWLAEGHTNSVTSCDFSPNGYHVATGSLDNTVKIWNLRQKKLEYTIPAHINFVTRVEYQKDNGYYLATSSSDGTVKFWCAQTCAPITSLDGHASKVPDFAVSRDDSYVAVCYSQYVKLWTRCLEEEDDDKS